MSCPRKGKDTPFFLRHTYSNSEIIKQDGEQKLSSRGNNREKYLQIIIPSCVKECLIRFLKVHLFQYNLFHFIY